MHILWGDILLHFLFFFLWGEGGCDFAGRAGEREVKRSLRPRLAPADRRGTAGARQAVALRAWRASFSSAGFCSPEDPLVG